MAKVKKLIKKVDRGQGRWYHNMGKPQRTIFFKEHTMKRMVALAAGLVLLIGLAWAGGGRDTQSSSATSDGPLVARGRIEVWYGGETFYDQFQAAKANIEKKFSGTQVLIEVIPYGEMATRMMTACQSNAGPDVMHQSVSITSGFMLQGLLEPLQGYYRRAGRNLMTEFNPDAFSIVRQGDNIYAVPNSAAVMALVYNKKLFAEAGLTRGPENWAEVYEWAEKLTKRNPDGTVVYGIGWPGGKAAGNIWFRLLPHIWSAGGDVCDPQMKTATMNTPAVKEAVAYYTGVLAKGIAPRSMMELDQAGIQPMFEAGNVAMTIENMDFPKSIQDRGIFDVGVVMWPGKNGPLKAGIGGWFACIPSSAKNKEGGAVYVTELTTPEVNSLSPPLPGSLEALKDPKWADPYYAPFMDALRSSAQHFPQFENSPQAQIIMLNLVQSVLAGVNTIDEAVIIANDEIQELLDIQNAK